MAPFYPKFDVREIPTAYELHGELPGIEQKAIEIEFTDAQTLTVSGTIERHYSSIPVKGAITKTTLNKEDGKKEHQATVENEDEKAKKDDEKEEMKDPKDVQDRLWVAERNIGEFARSFSFAEKIDQDVVRASMRNGVLSIVVPKVGKKESRRIVIQ